MTDRVKGLIVTLDKDYRDDDCEAITNAIRQIRGVLAVDLKVANCDHHMAVTRARAELLEKIWKALG
jgi:hypothetical protein